MKLYKDGRCMQSVDKDQLDICLEAGWSRIDKVAVEEAEMEALLEAEEAEKLAFLEAEKLAGEGGEGGEGDDEGSDEITDETPKTVVKPAPAKITRNRPLKKNK